MEEQLSTKDITDLSKFRHHTTGIFASISIFYSIAYPSPRIFPSVGGVRSESRILGPEFLGLRTLGHVKQKKFLF